MKTRRGSAAVSGIKTVVVIALLSTLATVLVNEVQVSAPINATLYPEAAAAQTSINAQTWSSLKMVGIVMLVIIISLVMRYLNFI